MLPIAEWHKGLFMESLSVMVRRKRWKGKSKDRRKRTQTAMRMSMDGMEVTRHFEALEPSEM